MVSSLRRDDGWRIWWVTMVVWRKGGSDAVAFSGEETKRKIEADAMARRKTKNLVRPNIMIFGNIGKSKWNGWRAKVYTRNLECSFLTIAEKGLSGKSSIDVGKKSLGVQLLTILIIGYWVGLGRLGLRRRSFMFYLINVFMKVKENPQLLGSSYWNIIHNLFIFDNDCCLTWAILLFAVKSFG